MNNLETLKEMVFHFGAGPLLEEMPRNTLEDKGLDGATAAHCIEEIHTPVNYAYITCTTGSSAFQNVVGVLHQELSGRVKAGMRALELAGLKSGDRMVITYPPLVSVFSRTALDKAEILVFFPCRPSRDALLLEICIQRPKAILGESSFLRTALEDAKKLGIWDYLPYGMIFLAAGTPMDPELPVLVEQLPGASLHDLYGCQEFGWLVLDGVPLREDICLWDSGRTDGRQHLLVGGLPTGDCFFVDNVGKEGADLSILIQTPSACRVEREPEVTLLETTLTDPMTAHRVTKTILRSKAKIVRVSETLLCKRPHTRLAVEIPGEKAQLIIEGDRKTALFDALVEGQKQYQRDRKENPVWNKESKT